MTPCKMNSVLHPSTSPLKLLKGSHRKQDLSSQNFVFFGRIGKTRWPPDLRLADTFSTSPLQPLHGIQRNLTGSKISTSSTKFVFFGPIEKKNQQEGHPVRSINNGGRGTLYSSGTLYSGVQAFMPIVCTKVFIFCNCHVS